MILLRFLILLFVGYPLYQDEQERFVCITTQPGCTNVCYDLFAPISLFRLWLVQLGTVCLPSIVFIIYVVHRVTDDLAKTLNSAGPIEDMQLYKQEEQEFSKTPGSKVSVWAERVVARRFTGAYLLQLSLRSLLEAGFGAAHYYYLFDRRMPKKFLCQLPPCNHVECYISKPTEKMVMLYFMLGLVAVSLFLNMLDFMSVIKRSVQQKYRRKLMVESMYEGELSASRANIEPNTLTRQAHEDAGTFRKRRGSKGSCRGAEAPGPELPLMNSAAPAICNTNGNNGCSALESGGGKAGLCPVDTVGTPRTILIGKHSHLKPSPPPRRDGCLHPAGPAGPVGENTPATAVCASTLGHWTLAEWGSSEGSEIKSQWV